MENMNAFTKDSGIQLPLNLVMGDNTICPVVKGYNDLKKRYPVAPLLMALNRDHTQCLILQNLESNYLEVVTVDYIGDAVIDGYFKDDILSNELTDKSIKELDEYNFSPEVIETAKVFLLRLKCIKETEELKVIMNKELDTITMELNVLGEIDGIYNAKEHMTTMLKGVDKYKRDCIEYHMKKLKELTRDNYDYNK